jgi:anti-sigma B factor antagonist
VLFAAVAVVRGGWSVLSITGDCDLASAPELRRELLRAASGADRLVVDLEGVGFLDSVGLGLLVGAARRVGELVVVAPEGPARRALRTSRVDEILDVRDAFAPT